MEGGPCTWLSEETAGEIASPESQSGAEEGIRSQRGGKAGQFLERKAFGWLLEVDWMSLQSMKQHMCVECVCNTCEWCRLCVDGNVLSRQTRREGGDGGSERERKALGRRLRKSRKVGRRSKPRQRREGWREGSESSHRREKGRERRWECHIDFVMCTCSSLFL